MTIIAYGNIQDGLNYIGPFNGFEAAREFAETQSLDQWQIVTLADPVEFK